MERTVLRPSPHALRRSAQPLVTAVAEYVRECLRVYAAAAVVYGKHGAFIGFEQRHAYAATAFAMCKAV